MQCNAISICNMSALLLLCELRRVRLADWFVFHSMVERGASALAQGHDTDSQAGASRQPGRRSQPQRRALDTASQFIHDSDAFLKGGNRSAAPPLAVPAPCCPLSPHMFFTVSELRSAQSLLGFYTKKGRMWKCKRCSGHCWPLSPFVLLMVLKPSSDCVLLHPGRQC